MTKEELERIKVAYHSGLKVQIWFNGNWKNFDAREYSMYKDPFSENRQYRIVGSDYADMAEKRIAELERNVAYYAERAKHAELDGRDIVLKNKDLEKENAELKDQLTKAKELLERLLITSCNSDVLNLLPNCSEVLRVRVEAEQFINNEGCPNCFCEDCTKEDCNIRKLGLVSNKEIENG